jgi:hypothetical protein
MAMIMKKQICSDYIQEEMNFKWHAYEETNLK